MERTINITIGSMAFTLEEDAFETLEIYLDDVKKHFSSFDDSNEIISDIEARIAEKFNEKLKKSKKETINLQEVKSIIKSLGSAKDFSEEEKDTPHKEESSDWKPGKRLYRNPDDVVIAGVCSGIATYIGVDPIIVRLLFVASVLFGGAGVLIYIIFWIIMPTAETTSQKLEMQGKPVTLGKIEKSIKKAAQNTNIKKSDVRRIIAIPFDLLKELFRILGLFLKKLVPIVSVIFGVIFFLVGFISILSTAIPFAIAFFNRSSDILNKDFPILETITGFNYCFGLLSGFLVVLVPLIYILLIGLTLIRRKNVFNVILNSVLIGLWMIAIITLSVISFRVAPNIEEKIYEIQEQRAEISENQTETTFDIKDFDSIKVGYIEDVIVRQGDEFSINANGNESDIEKINIEKKGNSLTISRKHQSIFSFGTARAVTFEITMPDLKNLEFSGASKGNIIDFTIENLDLSLSGASDVIVTANIENKTKINLSGASNLKLTGSSTQLTAELSGASNLKANNFELEKAEINTSGASNATVNVSGNLETDTSGASDIENTN